MIGTTIWIQDRNRRKYIDVDSDGNKILDRRNQFVPYTITGETRSSWLLDEGKSRINKVTFRLTGRLLSPGTHDRVFFSEQEITQYLWIEENRYKIENAVRRCTNYTLLQTIGQLLVADFENV